MTRTSNYGEIIYGCTNVVEYYLELRGFRSIFFFFVIIH